MWKFGIAEHVFNCKQFLTQPNGKVLTTTASDGKPSKEFGKADVVVNIIGSEQSYLQDLLKSLLRTMGYKQAENYHHVAYEHVVLPSEQFSGRLGTWVGYTADELLEEATKRAMVEVEKRSAKSGITEKEMERTARLIGLAAIKFSFLRVTPTKQVVFEWDRALSFEGDTGPYVQYACVRAKRILEKLGKKSGKMPEKYSFTPEEKELLKKIARFPELVRKAEKDLQSYYVAEYVLDLADAFSKFYETTPVLKAQPEQQEARALIVATVASVLERALGFIGIEVPEKM